MPRVSRVARIVDSASPNIPSPIPELEQYTTPGVIAARLANWIALHDDIGSARIADLGAGTCRLSLALALYGANYIVAVDIDSRLAPLCYQGFRMVGLASLTSYIVSRISGGRGPLRPNSLDLIVMNPPFGVQRRGMDTEFLSYAMSLKPRRIYAILKTGNEQYHRRLAAGHGYSYRVLYTEWFPIPASMMHHKSRIRRVMVDVAVFERL